MMISACHPSTRMRTCLLIHVNRCTSAVSLMIEAFLFFFFFEMQLKKLKQPQMIMTLWGYFTFCLYWQSPWVLLWLIRVLYTHKNTQMQPFQMIIRFCLCSLPTFIQKSLLFAPFHCSTPSVYPHYHSPCCSLSTFFHLIFSPAHCLSLVPLSRVSITVSLLQWVSAYSQQCCPPITCLLWHWYLWGHKRLHPTPNNVFRWLS